MVILALATVVSPPAAGAGVLADSGIFKLEYCAKGAVTGEAGFAVENALKGEGEGRVGAEAFGNGLMAKISAAPGAKLEGALKGEVAGEVAGCFDLLKLRDMIVAGTPPPGLNQAQQDFIVKIAQASAEALLVRLTNLGRVSNLDPAKVGRALDTIRQLEAPLRPFAGVEDISNLTALGGALPLPPKVQAQLAKAAELFELFEQNRELCTSTDLPPKLLAIVSDVCARAAAEPMVPLLTSTAGLVTTIKNDITNVVKPYVTTIRNEVVNFIKPILNTIRRAVCALSPTC